MAAPKRTSIQIERDRERTAELYCQGFTQRAIADKIGVSQGVINRDLAIIRERWLASSLRDFDAAKAEELAKLDAVEREAWAAYARTVGERTVTVHEEGTTSRGLVDKTTERTEPLAGNPTFLQVVMSCIERRCRILGIDASVKHDLTTQGEKLPSLADAKEEIAKLTAQELALLYRQKVRGEQGP